MLVLWVLLGIEPKALPFLGKCFAIELHARSQRFGFIMNYAEAIWLSGVDLEWK